MKRSLLFLLTALLVIGFAAPTSWAFVKVFKHDQFSSSIYNAAEEIPETSAALPSFAKGEAFGQIYRPDPSEYPVTIEGVDVFLGGPVNPAEPPLGAAAIIEVYIGDEEPGNPGPPASAEKFSVPTADMMLEGAAGGGGNTKLAPNTAMRLNFSYDDPDGHPPVVQSGQIWIMIRFQNDSPYNDAEWGFQCSDLLVPCGCQPVATLHDSVATPSANILNIFEDIVEILSAYEIGEA